MAATATAIIGLAPTNLGPLTTAFTPPPACTVAVGAVDGGLLGLGLLGGSPQNVAFLGQTCTAGKASDVASCWPPTTKGVQAPSGAFGGWGFYSPGLECPVGYATACSATGGSGGGSGWPVQFKLRDGETALGCCPSGYGCANINGQTCTMIATSTTVPTVTCDGTKSGAFAFQTVPDAKASITAFSLFAPMIQINFQSSDKPQQTTAPTSSSQSSKPTDSSPSPSDTTSIPSAIAPTASTSGAPAPTETLEVDGGQTTPAGTAGLGSSPTDEGQSQSTAGGQSQTGQKESSGGGGGLSTTAAVGLGVGGGVAALALLASVVIFCWRRKKNRREEEELDRLYGMKGLNSPHDPVGNEEIPGWYRGQRPTPSADRFRPGASELAGSPYHHAF